MVLPVALEQTIQTYFFFFFIFISSFSLLGQTGLTFDFTGVYFISRKHMNRPFASLI